LQILAQRNQILATAHFWESGFFLTSRASAVTTRKPKNPLLVVDYQCLYQKEHPPVKRNMRASFLTTNSGMLPHDLAAVGLNELPGDIGGAIAQQIVDHEAE
jgi:hypothetical protein